MLSKMVFFRIRSQFLSKRTHSNGNTEKFRAWASEHEFKYGEGGNESSPNIIATQWGTKYPDQYIVCGSHYDSYSHSGMCTCADDNATGVATVLETARILS